MSKFIFLALISIYYASVIPTKLETNYPIDVFVNVERNLLNFSLKNRLDKTLRTFYYALPWGNNISVLLKIVPYNISDKGIEYKNIIEPLTEIQDPVNITDIYFFEPKTEINGKIKLKKYFPSINNLLKESNIIICWKYNFLSLEEAPKFYPYYGYVNIQKVARKLQNKFQHFDNDFKEKCSVQDKSHYNNKEFMSSPPSSVENSLSTVNNLSSIL